MGNMQNICRLIHARRMIDQFRCDRAKKGAADKCPVILRYETS
ncbi:hypothetical protein [Bradyrhizobium liaoningense]|nr:hypothetical protein [Bradyrhizobium liaoningense]